MGTSRPSNRRCTEWNRQYQERLSAYIHKSTSISWSASANVILENKLGIKIELSQVRLKTNTDDPYTWERMDGKEHLFSKNISDHSTRALKELYEGIDVSFAAIGKSSIHEFHAGSVQENVYAVISRYWSDV